jgi:nucleotide-binding universal stress UspA family protein
MYRRIVVGFDDSEGAHDAAALGRLLADRTGAELVLAGVVGRHAASGIAEAALGGIMRDAEKDLGERVRRAAASLDARPEIVSSDSPAHGLHDLAEDMRAGVIVLGSSKAAPGRVRSGRTAMHLFHGSPAAVAVAPVGYRLEQPGLQVVGVAIDGSDESHEALRAAVELADGGTLRLIAVAANLASGYWGYGSWGYGLPELGRVAKEAAQANLDEALTKVPAELRPSVTVLTGDVARTLIDEAERGIDLLCLGSRGYGPLRRVLLGSVSAAVVKDAPCPVLVLPRSGVHAGDASRAPTVETTR